MHVAASRAPGAFLAAGLCVALAYCGGDGGSTEPQSPAALALATGGAQTGVAGASLLQAVGVKVTSSGGEPLAGVTVNFSVAANSGSLSAGSWKTNASGIASVMWTLGGKAGVDIDTLEASVSGLPDKTLTVTASARAAAPAEVVVISGDAQVGNEGEQASEPLVVAVRDGFGNPNDGIEVSWSVQGGGSLSAGKDTTDAAGMASVVWTLGAGDNRVSATIAELSDAITPFTAALTASEIVKLFSVSPSTLVESGSATLTGVGFSATSAGNRVFVDGVAAEITGASETSIQITVPAFDCKPARDAPVRVVVGSEGSNAVEQPLAGTGAAVSLAVGGQLIVRDPSSFCLQFGASASEAAYLIGAQSVSELPSSLTPVTVSATAASSQLLALGATPLSLASTMFASGGAMASVLITPSAQRWARHRSAEARLRARERELVRGRAGAGATAMRAPAPVAASSVPATVEVGDTVSINFPNINGEFCSTSIPITTVVRAKGTRGIWLEDVANPTGGYTVGDFEALSDQFDNEIYATDVAYFGEPTDGDGNGRVVVVTTKEVNKVPNVLGFVVNTDLPSDDNTCTSSNGGEFYYGRAPDADGDYEAPAPYSLADAQMDGPLLVAHEFTHVIQFGRRMSLPGADFQSQWEAEGQATLAQEVVGHDLNGLMPGNNYQFDKVAPGAFGDAIDWYSGAFVDLAIYFGYKGTDIHALNAPDQCTWLGRASGAPCISGREVYGVPWSFLRWLSDQFGPSFPGGEKGLQRALIDNTHAGYETIHDVIGVSVDSLLAQWAATLYVDDYWDALANPAPNPRLRFTSWDVREVLSHLGTAAALAPREHSFQSFSDAVSVRGGSTAYFRISGSAAPAIAVKLRDASGLPIAAGSPTQLWIVRLQ